jgi:response regulator RpfG family c-di-GMP phosphodiesterase
MSEDKKRTIMLIDDSSTNNILYESILIDEGYDVVACEDAKIALKKLQNDVPDLIILDLMMPGIDGFNFLEKKKEIIELQNVPVLMLTARVDRESEQKAYDLGVIGYMVKPIGIAEITEKIKKIFAS